MTMQERETACCCLGLCALPHTTRSCEVIQHIQCYLTCVQGPLPYFTQDPKRLYAITRAICVAQAVCKLCPMLHIFTCVIQAHEVITCAISIINTGQDRLRLGL